MGETKNFTQLLGGNVLLNRHTHARMHSLTHIHHTHTHHTHTHTRMHTHIHTHSHAHAHTHAHVHTHKHTTLTKDALCGLCNDMELAEIQKGFD